MYLLSLKTIDESRKEDIYIELDSNKGRKQMVQEEARKIRDKKMVATTGKIMNPNIDCKHYDVDGHMEEKLWKLHPELCPK